MKTILRVSLVLATTALGSSAWAAEGAAATEPAAAPAVEAKAEPSATAETKTVEATAPDTKPAETKPADAPPAAPVQVPKLVEGAPLGNANVSVNIVQKKIHENEGRHELVLYPAVLQINGKFTQHYGVGLMYAYHLRETLAISLMPIWNYWNQESDFNQELIDKGHQQAQAATALLLQYGGVASVEMSPIYGKFALYEGTLVHFALVLGGGLGAGSTRIQLRPQQVANCGPGTDTPECRSASFGDTGFKMLTTFNVGFRVMLGERAAIRLEIRDLIYTARVNQINGCSYEDLYSLSTGGNPVSGSCPANGGFATTDDRQLAMSLLKETSSDVINNVSFFAGFSFLF
ncbi:MAG TPA: outer membrane beta-barrel domain-containing protein [Vicinamibacterales bacterium]|jgi:outer membrane beta-barrel protein